jgi:hypothetical protein
MANGTETHPCVPKFMIKQSRGGKFVPGKLAGTL